MLKQVQHDTKRVAFTLAEVLITLAIIGVVAALTIPIINTTINKIELITGLKKAYSVLSMATDSIILENGPTTNWATNSSAIYALYKEQLIFSKDCDSVSGCFPQTPVKRLNGTLASDWNNQAAKSKAILADGMNLCIEFVKADCSSGSSLSEGVSGVCAWIEVDVNGTKGPNQVGRDVFEFALRKNDIVPDGIDDPSLCNSTASGYACAAYVLKYEKMDY